MKVPVIDGGLCLTNHIHWRWAPLYSAKNSPITIWWELSSHVYNQEEKKAPTWWEDLKWTLQYDAETCTKAAHIHTQYYKKHSIVSRIFFLLICMVTSCQAKLLEQSVLPCQAPWDQGAKLGMYSFRKSWTFEESWPTTSLF